MPRSSKPPKPKSQLSWPVALLVTFSLSLVLATSWLILTGMAALNLGWRQLTEVAAIAQTTPVALLAQGVSGWLATPTQANGRKNILVLGTDSLATRGDVPPLTDTILLMSTDLQTGQIYALSLPRDLWSDEYQTRINALYALGLQAQMAGKIQDPTQYIDQQVTDLTGVPIQNTVIISLEEVAELIDMMGGVSIDVPEGFIDYQFPRPDVDVTVERNPSKLYQTVEFEPGVEVMSGERALQYIRSRHAQGSEGSDTARGARQQLIIESLMKQLIAKSPTENTKLYAQLYAYYQQHFAQYLSMTELIATAKTLYPYKDQIAFHGSTLSIFPDEAGGVIYHPPLNTTNGAWIYRVRNSEALVMEAQDKLSIE